MAQFRVMKQPIANAINVLSMDFPGSIKRKDAIDRLRSAITPKGSKQ